jgi:hypothetical protein
MRGEVRFTAQDREFVLRYTTNALCRLEEESGESVMQLANDLGGGAISVAKVRLMFWAGLVPTVDVADAGDIMDDIGMARAAELVGKAFEAAFPSEDGASSGKKKTGAAA